RWPPARNRTQQRPRPDRQHLTAVSEVDRRWPRPRRQRMVDDGTERIQHRVDTGLHMSFAVAQGREPERYQRILKLTQIAPAQGQILQQISRARVPVRVTPLDPRTPLIRHLQQLLTDPRKPLDQRGLLMVAN